MRVPKHNPHKYVQYIVLNLFNITKYCQAAALPKWKLNSPYVAQGRLGLIDLGYYTL
jgi:hypothetical protein